MIQETVLTIVGVYKAMMIMNNSGKKIMHLNRERVHQLKVQIENFKSFK